MTEEQFKKLRSSDDLVQPNYTGYSNKGFRVLTISHREGLVEVDEAGFMNKTTWYRYENLSVVVYSKYIDPATYETVGFRPAEL